MSIVDVIEQFNPSDTEKLRSRLAELKQDTQIDEYLSRLPKGTLNLEEFTYVLDYFAEIELIHVYAPEVIKNELIENLLGKYGAIKVAFNDRKRLDKMTGDTLVSEIDKIGGTNNNFYEAFMTRATNYFGDAQIDGFAILQVKQYANNAINLYSEKISGNILGEERTKSTMELSRLSMHSQYVVVHESINSLPQLIQHELKK